MANRGGFSWKRAIGITKQKQRISRATGIPLTKSGRQRKVGKMATGGGCLLPCLTLLMGVALAVMLIGCGGAESTEGTTTTSAATTTSRAPSTTSTTAAPSTTTTAETTTTTTEMTTTTIATPAPSADGVTVYITKTGEKYHRGDCSSLSKSKIEILLSDAKAEGYEPCSRCDPPL